MIEKEKFNPAMLNDECLSLVEFKTEWNGACQLASMIYNDVAMVYEEVAKFYSINIELEDYWRKEYGINETPTILFFRQGKIIDHTVGLVPKDVLISKIEDALHAMKV